MEAYLDGKLDAFKVKKVSPNEIYDFAEEDLTVPYSLCVRR